MKNIFIDGSAGTTGLRIYERLAQRGDIRILTLSEELRKDPGARRDCINRADVVFLCLPDAAAEEAVSFCENPDTVIIDTSTAHRTAAGWTYGFPEIGNRRAQIAVSKRIANPGCHASGFVALAAPLTELGLLDAGSRLSCFSLTGFSGGGKKMIAEYGAGDASLQAPRLYGLSQTHKHLPEMQVIPGLRCAPVFSPIVSSYYAGMEVVIPLFADQVYGTAEDIAAAYRQYYTGTVVRYTEAADENGFLSAGAFCGRDDMQICVFGCKDRLTLTARFDNLGKGASGAAIQNMNIVLGADETEGLVIGG